MLIDISLHSFFNAIRAGAEVVVRVEDATAVRALRTYASIYGKNGERTDITGYKVSEDRLKVTIRAMPNYDGIIEERKNGNGRLHGDDE